jgi:hypothetical protein
LTLIIKTTIHEHSVKIPWPYTEDSSAAMDDSFEPHTDRDRHYIRQEMCAHLSKWMNIRDTQKVIDV